MLHPEVVGFNQEYGVLVDAQGIMLPLSTVRLLLEAVQTHCKHSKMELEAIGRRTVEDNHPRMVNQFNFAEYFE